MRYATGHKEATRARLLSMGGAVVKKHGFATTGVDSLMEAVGLTGGAFYTHFSSKSELLQAILERELATSYEMLASKSGLPLEKWLLHVLDQYLTFDHVKHPESGCPVPALSNEVARSDKAVKRVYETALGKMQSGLAQRLGDDAAWATIAQCVGAVLIARAMASETGGKKVLASSRSFLKKALLKKK
jgi:TetR/AcrR family transcriptional regulator, transcriptional repressor for nem operon